MALYTPEYKPTGKEVAIIKTFREPSGSSSMAKVHPSMLVLVELAQKGFYDNLKFHRYVPGSSKAIPTRAI